METNSIPSTPKADPYKLPTWATNLIAAMIICMIAFVVGQWTGRTSTKQQLEADQAKAQKACETELAASRLAVKNERAAAIKAGVAEYFVTIDGVEPTVEFRFIPMAALADKFINERVTAQIVAEKANKPVVMKSSLPTIDDVNTRSAILVDPIK